MKSSLASLIEAGTKLWLDSVDPELVKASRQLGATGATSNPIIISELIKTGRYDQDLARLLGQEGLSANDTAWALTDQVVAYAQEVFLPVWEATAGNDGYVSFEVDPLLEEPGNSLSDEERVAQYVELGSKWSAGRKNRMIKVPATAAGLAAVEELAARGVPLNVTLIFTLRQYQAAREAVWRGAQRLGNFEHFKSVYSIFVSRVDAYTKQHVPQLSPASQGLVGIVNAKQIWRDNQEFWRSRPTPLEQEMVFASTGTKNPDDPPWKYVEALAGSDIQTNPPATNEEVEKSGREFTRRVDEMPPAEVIQEIASQVDMQRLEDFLMAEGIKKFADPQQALIALIEEKRGALAT
ncbi:MAG: transaldolase [Planctomycetales bacterium]|nr:transaldolase [Planctomycetales bacterium]